MIEREKIHELVAQELEDANRTYPLFHSPHEAYAVLHEEVEELADETGGALMQLGYMWDDVRSDRDIGKAVKEIYNHAISAAQEAIQVAAMCDKIKQSNLYEE